MSKDFDSKLGDNLNANSEAINALLERAVNGEYEVWADRACDKCGCKHAQKIKVRGNETLALKVAQFQAERAFGKPAQRVHIEQNVDLTAMTLADKVVYLEQLRAQRAALPSGDDAA